MKLSSVSTVAVPLRRAGVWRCSSIRFFSEQNVCPLRSKATGSDAGRPSP
jgi:hypothetical protein